MKPWNDLLVNHPSNPGLDQKKNKVSWQQVEPQQAAIDLLKKKPASPSVFAYVHWF